MYFDHISQSVPNVYHRGIHKVLFKSSIEESKKDLTFVIEKHLESNLKIIISDEQDPCFLCVLIVTRNDYDELKKVQGLLIDFDSFPAQFVRLLQQCSSGNMFLSLQQQGQLNIILEIIERNEFKRLVHLSLKTGPASDGDIKRNMAENILILKKNVSKLNSILAANESSFHEKEQMLDLKIKDLKEMLSKTEEERFHKDSHHQEELKKEREKLEQERDEWKRCADLCTKTQTTSMQDALVRKDKQLDDVNLRCRQLQDTLKSLESQIIDKTQRIMSLEKQLHIARSDAESWRNQNGALDRDYHDKESNLQQTRTRLMDAEKTLKDKSDMLREALDSLQCLKREKALLEDKNKFSEAIATTNQTELKNSNEQLSKANQIIAKLNNDLLEIREKLMCRTAIALEQEKVIERNALEKMDSQKKERELLEEIERSKMMLEQAVRNSETGKRLISEKEEIIKNNNTGICNAMCTPKPNHRPTWCRTYSDVKSRPFICIHCYRCQPTGSVKAALAAAAKQPEWLHKKLDASQSTNDTTNMPSSRHLPSMYSSTPFISSRTMTDRNTAESNNDFLNFYSAGLGAKTTMGAASTNRYDAPSDSDERVTPPDNGQYSVDPVYLKPANYLSTRLSSGKSRDLTSKYSSESKSGTGSTNKENMNSDKTSSNRNFAAGRKQLAKDNKTNACSPISAYFPKS